MALVDPGNRFPFLELRDEEGRPAVLPRGEALYGFFKTTCPTCELAWPYLGCIGEIGSSGGLSVVAVSQDDPPATRRFYARLGVDLPTFYDPEPWIASQAVGLTSVPTFVRVDSLGIVRETVVGWVRDKMSNFATDAARRSSRAPVPLFSAVNQVPEIKPG